jgi:hypothetical protein
MDDTSQFLCLQEERLGIEVFAQTRDQLLRELQEQLVVLWQEYAAATDEALSPAALEIKRNLVAAIQEG